MHSDLSPKHDVLSVQHACRFICHDPVFPQLLQAHILRPQKSFIHIPEKSPEIACLSGKLLKDLHHIYRRILHFPIQKDQHLRKLPQDLDPSFSFAGKPKTKTAASGKHHCASSHFQDHPQQIHASPPSCTSPHGCARYVPRSSKIASTLPI